MGQAEVLGVLSKSKWMSVKDIARLTKTGVSSTTMACRRLRKHDMILWSTAKRPTGVKYFIYKLKGR